MTYENGKWRITKADNDDFKGLHIRVDSTTALHPVMETLVPRDVIEALLRGEDSSV